MHIIPYDQNREPSIKTSTEKQQLLLLAAVTLQGVNQ